MRTGVWDYLTAAATRAPEKTAVIDEENRWTYAQLEAHARDIGGMLAGMLAPRAPVAIYMEKSCRAIGAIWGAIYAGCFYVPLSADQPRARLKQMQATLGARVVLTDKENLAMAEELFAGAQIVCVDAPDPAAPAGVERPAMIDTDPLYACFTSGSGGAPKAVLVGQRSVLDFIDAFVECFDINSDDVIGNQAPLDFDVSVKDIYSAAKAGATLVLIPRRLFSAPAQLLDFICDHGITTLIWAVSALCLISTFHGLDYRTPDTVRRVLFSGEVMPMKHLRDWMEHLPEALFVNLYGPTEITCNCTYHVVARAAEYAEGLPIGRPFANERVMLLDDENRVIEAAGEIGEICVGGTALALGYYAAPEETARRFVQNPTQSDFPERIYRTGDLGRRNADGELFFCGRRDFQVKRMGHRIELEEIEGAIHTVAGVERCCCLFDAGKDKLYCFYVGDMDKRALYAALKPLLPPYMIPSAYRQVEKMPLTKNGKIDRRALAAGIGGVQG